MSVEKVSVISTTAGALLFTLRTSDLAALGTHFHSAGIDGVSVLPNRKVNSKTVAFLPNQVLIVEDTWNPPHSNCLLLAGPEGLAGEIYRRATQDKLKHPPRAVDGIFFLNQLASIAFIQAIMAQYPQALYASVHVEDPDQIEHQFPGRTILHSQRLHHRHPYPLDGLKQIAQVRNHRFLYDPAHPVTAPAPPPENIDWPNALSEIRQIKGYLVGIDIPLNRATVPQILSQNGKLPDFIKTALDQEGRLSFVRLEGVIPILAQIPPTRKSHLPQETQRFTEIVNSIRQIIA